MKIKNSALLILGFVMILLACEQRKNFDDDLPSSLNIITALQGNGTNATIDHLQGIINLVLPAKSDITKVKLDITAPAGVTVKPTAGSTIDLSKPIQVTADFGGKTRSYTLNARVLPSSIAFIGNKTTFDELISSSDDDIITAAQWVKQTYGDDFKYFDIHTLKHSDLQDVNVAVMYFDQVGTSDLPTELTTNKAPLVQFLVQGGKILLGGMATQYAAILGRDNSKLLTIKSNGSGSVSDGSWAIDGGVNFVSSKLNHPIYTFHPGTVTFDSNGYIPIIDAGFKEDHNSMWDAGPLLAAGHQPGQFNAFEAEYGGKVLGVWSGVTDECCPGIVEYVPNNVYAGTIIAIGIGGMEWHMNDGRINKYDGNIKAIYRNAIDYLSTL